LLLGGTVLLTALAGCGRNLTIHQDPYINTACHGNRPPDKRTGEPLELTMVVVYPADLKKPGNELLRPDSKITAKDWYERRPQLGVQETGTRFDLPKSQVSVLTNDERVFGRIIGSALRGSVLDGERPITKSNIPLAWDRVHDEGTIIYVFPKFIGRDGGVLPVPPARFCPPGAYQANLEIKVGVRPNRPLDEAQYIEILSPRKLYRTENQ
jgi:hypothetical protein